MKTCTYFKKYKGIVKPKCNCEGCWTKYFTMYPSRFVVVKQLLAADKKDIAVSMYGSKYVQKYTQVRSNLDVVMAA
jgi:hypothetical protein